jgi:ethanolamine utilization protein EutN
MIIATVVGTVIATRKNENLVGSKFLIIEPLKTIVEGSVKRLVAVDTVGAGVGEIVLAVQGSAARIACNKNEMPVDTAIVGIVDDLNEVIK